MFSLIQQDLAAVEQQLQSIIHSPVALVNDVGMHLVQAGGKRLRPALYLLCAKSGSREPGHMIDLAAAIELIHTATLLHDDVIDESLLRRGRPTANARWGNHVSVLGGDYLFAKSFSVISACAGTRELGILTNVVSAMCEGEIIQMKELFNPDQTEADYQFRIAKKTAEFIAASCELGGISAGMTEADSGRLRQFGYAIGMAFQITDDLLDVTGSLQQIGKPSGNDLRQGVITLPAIYALEHSPHANELRQHIVERKMEDGAISRCLEIVAESGALAWTEQRAQAYLTEAAQAIPGTMREEYRRALAAIIDFIKIRKF